MTSRAELGVWLATQADAHDSLPRALLRARAHVLRNVHGGTAIATATATATRCIDVFPRPSAAVLAAARAAGTLCRCRAMIQEVQSDIILYAASRRRFFGRVGDDDEDDEDDEGDDKRELMDAVQLYVLPVPGNVHLYTSQDDDDDEEEAIVVTVHKDGDDDGSAAAITATSTTATTILHGHDNDNNSNDHVDDGDDVLRRGCKRTQRTTTAATTTTTDALDDGGTTRTAPAAGTASLDAYLNLPHPAASPTLQVGCVVTVLLPRGTSSATATTTANSKDDSNKNETCDSDNDTTDVCMTTPPLRVNELVEFYGYLQPSTDDNDDDADDNNADDEEAQRDTSRYACRRRRHTADDKNDDDDDDDAFGVWRASRLHSSVVPRLLCIAWSPITHAPPRVGARSDAVVQNNNVDNDSNDGAADDNDDDENSSSHAAMTVPRWGCDYAVLREASVAYVARALCAGDALTAEYVLLHLCSRVHAHHAMTPVGDVPLLVRSPHVRAAAWSRVLRRLTPAGEVLLSRAVLDAAQSRVLPRHDADANYLRSGLLQVGNGSHVTMDCSDLMLTTTTTARPPPQQQQQQQRHAVSSSSSSPAWADAMFALVHRQILPLEYPYQTLELPVSMSCLALVQADAAATVHPLFDFALQLVWRPRGSKDDENDDDDEGAAGVTTHMSSNNDDSSSKTATTTADGVNAAVVRAYIAAVRRVTPSLGDDAEAAVQPYLAQALMRMAGDVSHWANRDALVHNNTFSAVTSLLRAHAASLGRAHVTAHDVDYVMQLEQRRMQRFASA